MQQYGLTKKQLKLFKFIKNYIAKKNYPPSYDEIKLAAGLKSKNSVNVYITNLEERGWLKRIKGKARSIQIIR
jgi:repressor LexA